MRHTLRLLVAVVVAGLVGSTTGSAQAPDAAGRWEVLLNAPDGPHRATLTLKKDGGTLTGTIAAPEGEYKIEGTQKGPDVSLTFTYPGDTPRVIKLTGTQKGDTMGGAAAFGDAAGDWSATRGGGGAATAPANAIDISGVWLFEVASAAGTGTPTMTFNQSGETVAGQYVGQLGEAPLKGTLKGGQLTFSFEITVQDTKLHVVYSGTATRDALKGTVSFGELGEGTFTARRK